MHSFKTFICKIYDRLNSHKKETKRKARLLRTRKWPKSGSVFREIVFVVKTIKKKLLKDFLNKVSKRNELIKNFRLRDSAILLPHKKKS